MGLFFKKPPEQPAAIKAIEEYPDFRIIRFQGKLQIATMDEIGRYVEWRRKQKGYKFKNLLLDFADVTYVDSSAIAAVVNALRLNIREHFKMGLMRLGDEPLSMLEITHVDKLVRVYGSEEEALSDMRSTPS